MPVPLRQITRVPVLRALGRARPSSFLLQVLLALAVVLVPPSVALLTATLSVEDLARTGSDTVVVAARTADLSRSLVDNVTAMERLARQRQVLGDEGLSELYEQRRGDFVAIAGRLVALGPAAPVGTRLEQLLADEAAVHAVLSSSPADSDMFGVAVERFADLAAQSRGILTESNAAITDAATDLQTDAAALERWLLVEAAFAVPLVLLLLSLALRAIVRPLRAVDDAIRDLGAGELDQPIVIQGSADLREVGARLDWLRQRLIAADADRLRLFRHVSHELKTPLASIREGAQLLIDGVLGPLHGDQREIVRIIGDNSAELQRRIEDFLRASDLRREGAQLELRPIDLADVVRAVIEQHAVPARSRSLRFDATLAPARIVGDPSKLRTVVDNLVTNAIKFSPIGGAVTITLEGPDTAGARARSDTAGARAGRDPGTFQLTVEDEGPGILPAERERVFEPFARGGEAWLGNIGGTGLGLTIAREYVRAHGGEVQIEDGRRGTRVVVRLHAEPPAGGVPVAALGSP